LALNINPKFAKAFNRLSKCHIALGDLYQASVQLLKAIELDPKNEANKKDQKYLADLKIVDTLVRKALDEEKYEKAIVNLNTLLK
jgi:tetratricopeptide (TPR) repeat protein